MSEEAPAAENPEAPVAEVEDKPKRKRRSGNRKPRDPQFKNWVSVVKSGGNQMNNTTMHLVINEATNVATFVSNAPKSEDEPNELEGERKQIFKITGFEVINIPAEEAAPEPSPED